MQHINCLALFCEDIREESNGVFTIIGIVPDNVNVATMPVGPSGQPQPDPSIKMWSKLCVFVRINFDPNYEIEEARMRLVPPKGPPMELGSIDRKIIDRSRAEALSKGNLLAGIVMRATLVGFPIPTNGMLKLELVFADESQVIGALNFKTQKDELKVTSSTAH